jgi:hypothetical protein
MTNPVTPIGGLVFQTPATPGTPIDALPKMLTGGYINNPFTATELLYVDPTKPATIGSNGTSMALRPGQTFYVIPNSTHPVSVASPNANHQFVAVRWT